MAGNLWHLILERVINTEVLQLLDHGRATVLIGPEERPAAIFSTGKNDPWVGCDHLIEASLIIFVDDFPKASLVAQGESVSRVRLEQARALFAYRGKSIGPRIRLLRKVLLLL